MNNERVCEEIRSLRAQLSTVTRERDEARKEAEQNQRVGNGIYKAITDRMSEYFDHESRELDWDVLPSTIATVCKERDTALAECQRLREALKERAFETAQAEHLEWCAATFPGETAEEMYEHFLEECAELGTNRELAKWLKENAQKITIDRAELADCFLLLCSISKAVGVEPVAAMLAKIAINKARKWKGNRHVEESAALNPPKPE